MHCSPSLALRSMRYLVATNHMGITRWLGNRCLTIRLQTGNWVRGLRHIIL